MAINGMKHITMGLGMLLHEIHNIQKHKVVRLTIYEDAVGDLVGKRFELDKFKAVVKFTIQSALNNEFEGFDIAYVNKGTNVGVPLLFSIDFQDKTSKLYGDIDFVNLANGKYLMQPGNAEGVMVDFSQDN